ncbi:MAG: NAD-binding protein [Nitriliruptoraceae bacterium]|nr:NAD-binding protein [Nitriliruptoraceae bacterium]
MPVKFATSMLSMLSAPLAGGGPRAMIRLILIFVASVLVFSTGFHAIMALEGRDFTWWTSIYWTLVTMSTLGFGDIVFESDLGRMYSVLVLLTGALLILILLPFTFIQLVYVPWSEAMREARAPRSLPDDTHGHIIFTGRGAMELVLMRRAELSGVPYVLLVEDSDEAASLHDEGFPVMVGELDEPDTYRAAQAHRAAMLLTTRSDEANTNIVFTLREVTDAGLAVTTANAEDAVDVLELAGADRIIRLGELLGGAFARRILAPTARCSTISTFEDLDIAETSAAGTELVGRSLAELDLRERFGVSVVGVWDRGSLQIATPQLRIEETSILLLAGRRQALAAYDDAYADDHDSGHGTLDGQPLVVVLGGGRVGRAAVRTLREAGTRCRIVDRLPERIAHLDGHVIGDAADLDVLREAGIDEASAVIITTHDDDTNIYLTLYCRKLRPDIEILGRVALDRNVSTMHRAGADFVLSYASTGAIEAWNALRHDSTLLLAEGLVVFRVAMPESLATKRLGDTDIPAHTGCTVIGILTDGACQTDLGADRVLPRNAELVLIGDDRAEQRFYDRYINGGPDSWLRRVGQKFRFDARQAT